MTTWTQRYLKLLDLEPPPALPDLDWLRRFGAAHLDAVSFCNVTAIQRRFEADGDAVPPVDHEAQLRAWEQRTGGGVCFEVAEMVSKLLGEMGYDVHLVLGQITFPASHQAVVVRLREGPYMVDLGCGAPLAEPIPLISTSEYHVAGLGYRFRPDLASMTCVQDRLIDGEWSEFCPYDLRPADPETREVGYQRHHIPGETWVIGSITLVRYLNGDVLALRDGRFTRYGADTSKQTLEVVSDAALERHVVEDLGWPELPVANAIQSLRTLRSRASTAD